MKEQMLGYSVDCEPNNVLLDEIFSAIQRLPRGGGAKQANSWIACLNPHSYAVALEDEGFARALRDADWLIPDGAGIVIASKLLGGRIRERVTGSDVFFGLHSRMNAATGMSVFFLGATEDTLARIRNRMATDYPSISVVGTFSPPFKPSYSTAELDEMIDAVNASRADVLWVGLTAPKQEKWIYENRSRLNVKFAGAIGAVFDFYTGQVKRSPLVFQRMGLEWLPRLIQQPRRLWRRMFISAPIFLWHVVKERLRRSAC